MNQIIEEGSGEAYWKARVESQGKAGGGTGGTGRGTAGRAASMESEKVGASF